MIKKAKYINILFLLLIPFSVKSQGDTLEVSLSQAMVYAIEFGYQSVNARHDITIAKKKVNETIAIGLPQINGSGSIANNLKLQENQIQFGDTTITTVFGTKYNNSIGGRVDQLLFDGSYFVGLQASKVYVRLSENVEQKTNIELKQAVAEAYFLSLVAKQNIQDFKINLETNLYTLKQIEAYYQKGFREDIEVDQIKLMVNESQRLYDDAENQYKIALSILKFAMGYDIEKPLKLSDDINKILVSIPVKPEYENDIKTHIDYKTVQTQIDIQGLAIKNQKALAMPRLSAFLTYDYTFFGQNWSDLVKTEGSMVGVGLSIPIFSSGQRSAQMKQKKLELNKLNVEKQMVEQSLKRDLIVAKANLDNARKQFLNARESKEISDRIYQKSLIKFKNGLLNSLELSQNESNMTEAVINYNGAALNYFNLFIKFKKATSQL